MPASQIGRFHYKVSTRNKRAQAYFDQGLAMIYGYQYGSAERSFKEAIKLDPQCAMAYWGLAMANGTTINSPDVSDERAKAALNALDSADTAVEATPLERELVAAERKRFSMPSPKDRTTLNADYADAMRIIWRRHPNDPNIGALFADALIDQHPWDQWTPDGQPKAGTEELMSTLDDILKLDPRHPHALHLYIHAYEASPFPVRAKFAADGLENLQPGLGHMQHMPCHVYVHTGDWDKAVQANLNCLEVTEAYLRSRNLLQRKATFADHYEMALAYAAAMRGQSALAASAIDRIFKGQNLDELLKDDPSLDGESAMPLEIMKRFGKWDDILAAPDYGPKSPISNVMRFACRAVAFAAKDQLEGAKKEQASLEAALAAIPAEARFDQFDSVHQYLDVEKHLVAGEILIREEGHMDNGLAELQKGVEAQDALHYSEPPDWLIPARHSLGAALVMAKKYPEAEAVYQDDLKRNPENGWSLYGLAKTLRLEGKTSLAAKVDRRFKKAWSSADTAIESSCLCIPGKS